jgi:ABC-type branched-subunit amino acid transport system substrate-binding protein
VSGEGHGICWGLCMGGVRYRVGVLFSLSGAYGVVSRTMSNGALLACDEINRSGQYDFQLEPVIADPAGDPSRYDALSAELIGSGIRHVVGCYTSSSRKDVIPNFEKHDALLWYPSHYEGFESSNNVIYTGAAPNQHIIPLIEFLAANIGKRAYCIGQNYIWAWENNRIMREGLAACGGSIAAERYLPVGEADHSKVIAAIIETRPDFVFNTLIGTSAYRFYRDFRAACVVNGIDQPEEIPVVSCSLSEPELHEIGQFAMDGHISSSVYFSTIATETNRAFVEAYDRLYPDGPDVCADAEASYIAVKLLAASIASAGGEDVDAVRKAVSKQQIDAPQGRVRVDSKTFHASLTPRIGKSGHDRRFQVVYQAREPVVADPYLVQTSPRYTVHSGQSRIRLVS